jgi:aspartate aminotransferase
MRSALIDRLRSARQVLAGVDATGKRVHPGMFDPGVISLAHGDGVRRPHPGAVAAGVSALLETERASLDDYLFLQRHDEFEAAITADFRRNGIHADSAANVCVDSGTTRLFAGFLHTLTRPGDVIGVPRSYYHPLPSWCELFRVNLELVQTGPTTDFKLTAAALDDWYRQHRSTPPRALFLFNPTQTGALYRDDELADIAEVLRRTGLAVLEDSVFAGTEFPGQSRVRHLAAVAPDLADRVVTLKGSSKAHNLANIRIGWGCGPAELIRAMNDYTVTTSVTIPFLAKAMGLAALRAPTEYLADNAQECAERAALVADLADEINDVVDRPPGQPLLTVAHQPQAGHAILLAAPGLLGCRLPDGSTVRHSIDVTRFLLAEANVAVSPGYSLGFDSTEVRVVFGSVGLKHTYPPVAISELSSALHQLATICDRSRPDIARRVYQASEALSEDGAKPGAELFRPGRELIETAFRERIAGALLSLLGDQPKPQLARLT